MSNASFLSAGTPAYGGPTFALGIPPGIAAGMGMISVISADAPGGFTMTPPTGVGTWTLLYSLDNFLESDDGQALKVYWRVATGSEPSSENWTSSAAKTGGQIFAASDIVSSGPVLPPGFLSGSLALNASGSACTAGSIDIPALALEMILYVPDAQTASKEWSGLFAGAGFTDVPTPSGGSLGYGEVSVSYRNAQSQQKTGVITGTSTAALSTPGVAGWVTLHLYWLDANAVTISAQPASQQVPAGATATFSVTAAGATSYQWQDNSSGSWSNISGETSSTYTTGALAAGLSYAVRCAATNATNTTYSEPANLWTPTIKSRAWAGYYNRAGQRDIMRMTTMLPNSKSAGLIAASAMFGLPVLNAALAVTEANDTLSSDVTGGGSSGLNASLAITEANDTLSSGATAATAATLAVTEANDTLSSGVTVPLAATLAVTEANDTLASGATDSIAATSSFTEANDTLSSGVTGALVATLSTTEANDTLSSGATAAAAATFVVTEVNDTLSSGVTVPLAATLAATEANDTLASGVTVPLAATLAVTEANDTLSSGVTDAIAASLVVTEAPDTLSSGTTAAVGATSSFTEANDTLSSGATLTVGASLVVTEGTDSLASDATEAIVADVAYTEADDSLASIVSGSGGMFLAVTEAPDTLSSDATEAIAATVAITEAPDALSATVGATIAASVAATEADDTLSSDASSSAGLSAVFTEADDTLSAALTAAIAATLSVVEATDTLSADARAALVAALDALEDDDVAAAILVAQITANVAFTEAPDTLTSFATEAGSGGGGGATPEEIWNYVLSNGLTAGETLAQALAHAQNCCG